MGRLGRTGGSVLISIVVTLVLWEGFIRFYNVQPIIAKDPLDVWRYLVTQHTDTVHGFRSATANRDVLIHNLLTTLRDAGLGYGAGIVLAMAVGSLFVLRREVEQTFMPLALVLRAVPLVAMAPLITLIFGHGAVSAAVIGGIVCFFPALVNVVFGLRAAPASAVDLMRALGGSSVQTLRKVQIPAAMPSIFAALRINVPASIVGALLAEWLATGHGSGAEMLTVVNTFDYGELWSAVVLVTLVSIIGYSVISALEGVVLARFAPGTGGRAA